MEDALERELTKAMRPAGPRSRSRKSGTSGVEHRVRDVLIPVEPSQRFIQELGHGLALTTAHSRRTMLRRYRVAVVGSVILFGSLASAVGVVALILRQRARTGLISTS